MYHMTVIDRTGGMIINSPDNVNERGERPKTNVFGAHSFETATHGIWDVDKIHAKSIFQCHRAIHNEFIMD